MSEEKENQLEKNLKNAGFEKAEFEVKTKNRMIVKIVDDKGESVGIPSYMIKAIERPKWHRWVEGKGIWEAVKMRLYDPISPSASKTLYGLLDKNLTFNINVTLLGPVGDKIEEWEFFKAKLTEVDFGELAWNSKDPTEITVTFSYESAQLRY